MLLFPSPTSDYPTQNSHLPPPFTPTPILVHFSVQLRIHLYATPTPPPTGVAEKKDLRGVQFRAKRKIIFMPLPIELSWEITIEGRELYFSLNYGGNFTSGG